LLQYFIRKANRFNQLNFATSNFIDNLDEVPEGVNIKQLTVDNFKPFPDCWLETTLASFGGYLPEALSKGTYKVAPPPLVVNRKGLEGIQEAIDLMRDISEKGLQSAIEDIHRIKRDIKEDNISAIKLVVELDTPCVTAPTAQHGRRSGQTIYDRTNDS
jgi:hypothetical protein